MVSNPSNKVKTEAINGVILRLLGLNPGVELDYQTYNDIIKKKLVISNIAGGSLPREEEEILREELKRVRRIKDKGLRFKVKTSKAKVSTGATPGPGVGGASPKTGAIVKAKTAKIVPQKIIPVNVKDVTEKKEERVSGFDQIKKTLNSILSILESKFKFDKKQSDQDRKDKETEKRSKRESGLEGFKRGISAISGAVKKVLAPFQSIIDRIWKFIFFTLLGRAFTKFMEWLNDKGNQEKFNSFIEFLVDHWPALAGIYVLFGTSFGKLVRGLLKGVTRMTVALLTNIPKIASFIKRKPRLSGVLFGAAALTSGYVSREIKDIFSDKKESPEAGLIPTKNPELDQAKQSADQATNAKVPTFNVGGMIPKFNLGGMLPSFAMGAMNPFGGMDFQSGVPITGAGKDDTLIAAKTGEAIVTEKDQRDISQRYVDKKTGEPLNIPQYLSGRKPGKVSLSNLRFPGFGGGFFGGGMISKFNNGGVIGSGILPGTGTVMAPKTMGNTTVAGYQNKFLGIPLGRVNYPKDSSGYATGYSQQQMQRYERYNPNKQFKNLGGIFPALINRTKDNIVGDAFRNFGTNVKTIKGAAFRQEEMMRQMGYEPSGYTNLLGQPIKRQGGGEIEALEKTYMQGQKSGMSPEVLKAIGDEAFLLKNFGVGGTWRNFRGSGASNMRGEPLPIRKKQGGGLIDIESRIDRMINQSLPQTLMDYNQQVEQGQSQPIDPKIFQQELERQRRNVKMKLLRNYLLQQQSIPQKNGGGIYGLVKENTGFDIAGATADRQGVNLQPGEYVLTRDFVDRVGVPALDKLVAYFDSNSNPAKLGVKSKNIPNITPLPRGGSGGMITLPPIIQSASGSGNVGNSSGAGSRAPVFSTVSASGARQIAETASILGIVG